MREYSQVQVQQYPSIYTITCTGCGDSVTWRDGKVGEKRYCCRCGELMGPYATGMLQSPPELVTRTECSRLVCDMCGVESAQPATEMFEGPAVRGSRGEFKVIVDVDGKVDTHRLDFCYNCAWRLSEKITAGSIHAA